MAVNPLNFLQLFLTSSLCIFMWSTFLLWLTLVNEIFRILASLLLVFSRYELLQNGQDSINWSYLHTGKMVVIGLYSSSSSGEIDLQQEIATFGRAFSKREEDGRLAYSKLMKILVVKYGYGCLLDNANKFRVQDHVKIFPGTDDQNEIHEADFTANILPQLMRTMDESKPQWEWLIFPKIRRANGGQLQSLRIFRYDHGYMDGASAGLFLAENIFDQHPQPPEFFINPRKSYTSSSLVNSLLGWWAYFNLPLFLIKETLICTLRGRKHTPFSIQPEKGGKSSNKKHIFGGPVHLDYGSIKDKAGSGHGGNITSLLLHSLPPALHHVLPPNEKKKCGSHCSIAVSTLGAILPYLGSEPRNQFTTLDALLPLSPKTHDLDNTRDKDEKKICYPVRDWSYHFSKAHMDWGGRFPIPLLRLFSSGGEASLCLNNIPFLRRKGTIQGSPVEQVVGWGMLVAPIGLEIMAIAYGEQIALTFHTLQDCLTKDELQTFIKQFKSNITSSAGSHLLNEIRGILQEDNVKKLV